MLCNIRVDTDNEHYSERVNIRIFNFEMCARSKRFYYFQIRNMYTDVKSIVSHFYWVKVRVSTVLFLPSKIFLLHFFKKNETHRRRLTLELQEETHHS